MKYDDHTQTAELNAARRKWLVSLLAGRPRLRARLAYFYARLRGLPRGQRRRLARRAAVSLSGAALMLALSGAPVGAATIAVANGEVAAADNAKCSLIEAFANANDTVDGTGDVPGADDCVAGSPGGADTITLPAGGLFTLTAVDNSFYGDSGTPVIETAVTVQGNGATIQRTGDKPFRLLAVAATGDLTLDKLTLKGGEAYYDFGGAVLAYGDLTVRDCTLTGNTADTGGAIFGYSGAISISGTTLSNNDTVYGGALVSQYGTLTLSNSTISGNDGQNGSGGAYFLESTVTLTGATIRDNTGFNGGGVQATTTTLTLTGGRVTGNKATDGYGGGLYLRDSTANIAGATISGNTGKIGAGIAAVGGNVTLATSSVTGNTAQGDGGGLYHFDGALTVQRSTLADNKAARGGGIFNRQGAVVAANSTLSGNTATTGGGATNMGAMTLHNVTVTDNAATAGDGGGVANREAAADLALRRSLIAGNTATGAGREVFHGGKSVTTGFDLLGFGGNAGVAGFAPGGSDKVPPGALATVLDTTLKSNGGPTQTHALTTGGPAIDAAPSAECNAAPVGAIDQRGEVRNRDANNQTTSNECDIGSFEAPGKAPQRWTVFLPLGMRP